jgi:hypothetical protein
MLKKLLVRHRSLRVAATIVGASALAIGFASPALATSPGGGNTTSQNYNIFQGGSNTTYLMMQALGDVFNQAPGCDLATASGTQALDYGCPGLNGEQGVTKSNGAAADGENGFVPFAQENPFNDVLIEEPAIGSSNGIAQLELQGAHGTATFDNVTELSGSNVICRAAAFPGAQSNDTITSAGTNFPAGSVSSVGSGTNASCPTAADNITLSTTATASSTTDSVTTVALQNASPLDSARSSRAPNLTTGSSAGDNKGLNFVAYAMDGVSWFHWTASAPEGTAPSKTGPAAVATPSASVVNLTVAQLHAIYTNSLSCTVGGSTYTENWICVQPNSVTQLAGGTFQNHCLAGPSSACPYDAPIAVYIAQNGSGTESTWASALGLTGTFPFGGGENTAHTIFENETESIYSDPANDEADAIFFFSYGKFNTVCPGAAATPTVFGSAGYCGTKPASGLNSGTAVALGEMNGVAVNQATIANQLPNATSCTAPENGWTFAGGSTTLKNANSSFVVSSLDGDTITDLTTPGNIAPGTAVKKIITSPSLKMKATSPTAGTSAVAGDQLEFCTSIFPGDRLLYNVYSNGSNPDIPQSSSATLNAISEDGFLCKASTASDNDPNTGNSYLSEIQSIIHEQGFFPLTQVSGLTTPIVEDGNGSTASPYTTTASGITHNAWNYGSQQLDTSKYAGSVEAGSPWNFPSGDQDTDGVGGGTAINPKGFCLVLTTDGNSTN